MFVCLLHEDKGPAKYMTIRISDEVLKKKQKQNNSLGLLNIIVVLPIISNTVHNSLRISITIKLQLRKYIKLH